MASRKSFFLDDNQDIRFRLKYEYQNKSRILQTILIDLPFSWQKKLQEASALFPNVEHIVKEMFPSRLIMDAEFFGIDRGNQS